MWSLEIDFDAGADKTLSLYENQERNYMIAEGEEAERCVSSELI